MSCEDEDEKHKDKCCRDCKPPALHRGMREKE